MSVTACRLCIDQSGYGDDGTDTWHEEKSLSLFKQAVNQIFPDLSPGDKLAVLSSPSNPAPETIGNPAENGDTNHEKL